MKNGSNTKYVPIEPTIMNTMHNEAIPKCVTNDIIPATEKPAQFKYSVFDKNCRKATIPNNGIDDDKKSINGANPIKLLTFNPFAIIVTIILKLRELAPLFSTNRHGTCEVAKQPCLLIGLGLDYPPIFPFVKFSASASSNTIILTSL